MSGWDIPDCGYIEQGLIVLGIYRATDTSGCGYIDREYQAGDLLCLGYIRLGQIGQGIYRVVDISGLGYIRL